MNSSFRQISASAPEGFSDYELIDSGNFYKLERFGTIVVSRPEPQAIWAPALSETRWVEQADARFIKDKNNPEKGEWVRKARTPDNWWITFKHAEGSFKLKVFLSAFKHVGVFPEQASNWAYQMEQIKALQEKGIEQPKILNLFAYTGAASLAAAAAGAEVTHLDAIKQVVSIARENMEASKLAGIRWIVDDALKFAKREVRRGNTYHGIILDPPAYGRGPEGEKWLLEEHLPILLQEVKALMASEGCFLILNLYSLGFSALITQSLVNTLFPAEFEANAGELFVNESTSRGVTLPLGTYLRLKNY